MEHLYKIKALFILSCKQKDSSFAINPKSNVATKGLIDWNLKEIAFLETA
jgi:hypothetical protein